MVPRETTTEPGTNPSHATVAIKTETPSRARMRREMPFAPALVAGLAAAIIATLLTGEGSCAAWGLNQTCS